MKEYPSKISEMSKILLKYTNQVGLVNAVLENERFRTWTGSSHEGRHHYGNGGLQHHTYEVLKLCMENAMVLDGFGNKVDSEILAIAALYHDFGKIYDYKLTDAKGQREVWAATDHKHKIHHIHRSIMIFQETCTYNGHLNIDDRDKVIHCILSHHGQPDWGSAIKPQTIEAWILHLSDMMSARSNDNLIENSGE